jgi:hydrogenase nickel incorporation protein HypA/HybF
VHELSIVLGLRDQLAALAKQHGARRIHRVALDVGALANVVPELVRHAFAAVQEDDPLLAGTALEIREIPLTVACLDCEARTAIDVLKLRCPQCGSTRARLVAGEELTLRDVELELADAP